MLYKMDMADGIPQGLRPQGFLNFGNMELLEQHLETLLAENLLDVLFEQDPLMTIFRQRPRQGEADIYALDRMGDLVIFELKRGDAGEDATLQALRYVQDAGQWTFDTLERKYRQFVENDNCSIREAHKDAFHLDPMLLPSEFNRHQRIIVVGNAADENLIIAVDYWKRQGLSVDFLPYRVYKIADQYFFEFFSLPYDRHQNPALMRGILFDTNRTYNENAIWEMMEMRRVAAYGRNMHVVEHLKENDIVFFSHTRTGLVAAGSVVGPVMANVPGEMYRNVEFLTPIPHRGQPLIAMPFARVSEVTGKTFRWARTIKVPSLSYEEATILLEALQQRLADG